jgi:outer membrane lipoprotein-sorting protein
MKQSILIFLLFVVTTTFLYSQTLPSANVLLENVNSRDEGKHVIQNFDMVLTNKGGKTQTRQTKIYRLDYADQRKSIVLFTNPSNVKGTAFMSYDYNDLKKDDDQWLYLPALKKTRRISASNRGDYFLGTDFTYEDIKLGSKMSKSDYRYNTITEEPVDGDRCYLVEGTPVNDQIAKELGYRKVHYWIDAGSWMIRRIQFWDVAGNLLKTSQISKVEKVDGIWTVLKLEAENHKTGHKTSIAFSSVDYKTNINGDLFSEESLMRGVN